MAGQIPAHNFENNDMKKLLDLSSPGRIKKKQKLIDLLQKEHIKKNKN